MLISLLLFPNFKLEGKVIQFKSLNSYFVFKLVRTEDAVDARFIFFDKESFPSFFFTLILVSLFFYSLTAEESFWVAANLRILPS